MKIGVLEAGIDSDVNAGMAGDGLCVLGTEGLDFAILENTGNLVCPVSFDTAA